MNGQNADGAPVVAVEGAPVVPSVENAAPVAPKAAKKRNRKPAKTGSNTIARRQVLAGKHQQTGAPKLPVIGLTTKRLKGHFSLKQIFELNGKTISLLTIKKRKNELIAAGELCKDAEAAKMQHEGHGRPPEYFNFDMTKAAPAPAKRTRKAKAAPVVAAEGEQAPAPVEQAPAEQPAPVAAPAEPVAA